MVFLALDEESRAQAGLERGVLQIWRKAGTDEVALIMAADAVDRMQPQLRQAITQSAQRAVPWPLPPSWQPDWPSGPAAPAPDYGLGTE